MRNATYRTIEELLTRYQLHPDLCDVYVEGEADRDFLKWFFEVCGRDKVAVYPIGSIDISAGAILGEGLDDSNKGRVICLALFLEQNLGDPIHVICIADKDFDDALKIEHKATCLVVSDYTSLEMYGFTTETVHKITRVVGCDAEANGVEILSSIEPLLTRLFYVRATSIALACLIHEG